MNTCRVLWLLALAPLCGCGLADAFWMSPLPFGIAVVACEDGVAELAYEIDEGEYYCCFYGNDDGQLAVANAYSCASPGGIDRECVIQGIVDDEAQIQCCAENETTRYDDEADVERCCNQDSVDGVVECRDEGGCRYDPATENAVCCPEGEARLVVTDVVVGGDDQTEVQCCQQGGVTAYSCDGDPCVLNDGNIICGPQ